MENKTMTLLLLYNNIINDLSSNKLGKQLNFQLSCILVENLFTIFLSAVILRDRWVSYQNPRCHLVVVITRYLLTITTLT